MHRGLGAVIGGAVARHALDESATRPELHAELIRQLATQTAITTGGPTFERLLDSALREPGATPDSVERAGMIAGAAVGVQGIPSRLTRSLLGAPGRPDRLRQLTSASHQIIGIPERRETRPEGPVGPALVHDDGIYAANLAGAARSPADMAIVSLCRGAGLFDERSLRHELYLIDEPDPEQNPRLHDVVADAVTTIDEFLAEGRPVVVHCHGGRSRTALVLKAWYMRRHATGHDEAYRWLTDCWDLTSDWNHRFTDFLDHDWSNR